MKRLLVRLGALFGVVLVGFLAGCSIDSTSRVLPEYQHPLEIGDRVIRMCRYAPHNPVALFEEERALVLGAVTDSPDEVKRGEVSSTWAWILDPVDSDTTRLIVRTRDSAFGTRFQGSIQFVMQRQTMRGIEHRAEGAAVPLVDVMEPALWLLMAAVFLLASVRVVVQRKGWWLPLLMALAALVACQWLMFWQPPLLVGAAVTALLVGTLAYSIVIGLRRVEPVGAKPGSPEVASGG